jgi:hypothetical protein
VVKYYYKSLLITNASSEFDSEKEIIIPYDTDLTNLKSRLAALESGSREGGGSVGSSGLTIEKINEINLYIGINEFYNTYIFKIPYKIPFEKNEQFFSIIKYMQLVIFYVIL